MHVSIAISSIVEQAFQAKVAGDIELFLGLGHTDAMDQFKATVRGLVQLEEMQAEAAKASRAQSELRHRRAPGIICEVLGVVGAQAFDQLPAREVLRRWLGSTWRAGAADPDFALSLGSRLMLGTVFESPDFVHVVFRTVGEIDHSPSVEDSRKHSVRLVSVKRDGSDWKVLLNGGLVFDSTGEFGFVVENTP